MFSMLHPVFILSLRFAQVCASWLSSEAHIYSIKKSSNQTAVLIHVLQGYRFRVESLSHRNCMEAHGDHLRFDSNGLNAGYVKDSFSSLCQKKKTQLLRLQPFTQSSKKILKSCPILQNYNGIIRVALCTVVSQLTWHCSAYSILPLEFNSSVSNSSIYCTQ